MISFLIFVLAQFNHSDGPYVFHRGDKIIVCQIENGICSIDSFPVSEKTRHSLDVKFADHPQWNFSVHLKARINIEPAEFSKTSRFFVCSDIEGEFGVFRSLLIANHVINDTYEWLFDKGVLVIDGDIFDRGKDVAGILWLLYKLEDEARAKGGYVHVILGNHEIMNLSGDYGFVDSRYFKSARVMGTDYSELYTSYTELGAWLRSKNVIEKIGDLLVMHGGISPEVNAMAISIKDINRWCRPYYAKGIDMDGIPDPIQPLFDGIGPSPFWYRGYFLDPRASMSEVDNTLKFYTANHIIVGHNIVENISSMYNGKVIGVDVNEHAGNMQGLLIENNLFFAADLNGNKIPL